MSPAPERKAFVPGFNHDVFVSYAQVDDIPDIDSQPGWVTNLVQKLSSRLAQQLGGNEKFSLWMDRKHGAGLGGNEPISEKIADTLENTAILLVILSPAYLEREWCKTELAAFSQAMGKTKFGNGRIFIVERESVDQSSRPSHLQNLRGYRFWIDKHGEGHRTLGIPVPSAEEREYWDELTGLSAALAKELRQIKTAGINPADSKAIAPGPVDTVSAMTVTPSAPIVQRETQAPSTNTDRPRVFLAEATDDLYYVRKQVVDYLDQAGIDVLPSSNQQYPFDEAEFRAAVAQDLEATDTICVQLLSAVPGRYQHFVAIQSEMAAASGKPVLQWRSQDLDLSQVEDVKLRKLLDGEIVQAVGIEEFKKMIVERAQSIARAPALPNAALFVRVSADREDVELLRSVEEVLNRNQIYYDAGEMDDLNEELKYVFENCDGLLIPHGKADVREVEKRLRACRTQMFRHKRKPLLAVFQAPRDSPSPGISMPGMQVVKGELPVDEADLLQFIDDLRANAARQGG